MKDVFTVKPPISILLSLCDKHFKKIHDMFYLIDPQGFRMMVHEEKHLGFLQDLKLFYKPGKIFYTTREFTYKSFLTIVRHICNANSRYFTTKVHYDHAVPNILYYVSLN